MGEGKAARSKHLSHITQTQFIAQPPHNREQHNVRGEFKVVEWRASSFIEGALTVRAEERCVPKFGFLRSFLRRNCRAMGTGHQPEFLISSYFNTISILEACLF